MKAFIIDPSMCNGCFNCQIACKDEFVGNDWPPYSSAQPEVGQFWMKLTQKVRGTVPKVKVSYIGIPCMHCDNAPCLKAAINGAVYKRPDGIVMFDPVKSAGQKALVAACPYGAVYWNEALNIPQKCTGCAHILDNSGLAGGIQTPRCVDACQTGAIQFGEESDLAPLIGQAQVLNPEYGTQPRVYYLNLPKTFLAGTLADPVADECVEGATVTATDLTNGTVHSTITDDFGDFWLEGLTSNRSYEVNIKAPGYLLRQQVVFVGTDTNMGDIELFAGGT
jgi:tetrathionate reductase subunit B